MRTRSIQFCGTILGMSLLMSACDMTMGASSQNSQTAPSTVTITSTQAAPSSTGTVIPTGTTPVSDPEACADNSDALSQSALGPALASKKLPTSEPGWTFNIDATRDQNYNPCLKLSWIEVVGNNGGTAIQVVPIFFEYGELIPGQQPQQFDSILSSERKFDDTIEILYGYEGYQWMTNGITEVPITYSLSGNRLWGSEQIPVNLVDLVKIDLTSFA